MREIERRKVAVEVRAEKDDEGVRSFVGYAAVFDSPSEDLGGFREVILPGAFDRALKERHDVRALVNHNPDLILGRTKAGTLDLKADKRGLLSTIRPGDTQAARDAATSIERGDIDGMSFAFRVLSDDWRTEDGEPLREVRDLQLYDVSVVSYPAYAETQVDLRAVSVGREALDKAATVAAEIPLELRRRRLEHSIRSAS